MNVFAYFSGFPETSPLVPVHLASDSLWTWRYFYFCHQCHVYFPLKKKSAGLITLSKMCPINVRVTAAVLLGIKDKVIGLTSPGPVRWIFPPCTRTKQHSSNRKRVYVCQHEELAQILISAASRALHRSPKFDATLSRLLTSCNSAASKCCQSWLNLSAPCMFHSCSLLLALPKSGWRGSRDNWRFLPRSNFSSCFAKSDTRGVKNPSGGRPGNMQMWWLML